MVIEIMFGRKAVEITNLP